MRREYKDYIDDIADSMEKAMRFLEHMNFDEFTKDEKTIFAVVRALEIIGEAVKHIPAPIRRKYPEIPWREMAGMRDKVIHEYFGVDLKIIWNVVKERIPVLKPIFEKIRKDYDD
jgi:uncharacterized protein with HEPN domain